MGARSSRLLSSLRRSNDEAKATSTSLPSLQRSLFSGSPTPGTSYWLPRSQSKWRILPTSPNRSLPSFEFVKRRMVALGRCFGKKFLSSSIFRLTFVSGMINRQASTLHAFDDFIDDEEELVAPSGRPNDQLRPIFTIVLKEKKPSDKSVRESFVCGACGQLGHMRTNKNCPKYGEEPETSELESISAKPSHSDIATLLKNLL